MRHSTILFAFLAFFLSACAESPTESSLADGDLQELPSNLLGDPSYGVLAGDLLPVPERPAELPDAPIFDLRAAGGPAAGFPVVLVRSGGGADRSTAAGAPVVDNLADAVARVADGGTIRVQAGTYLVDEVVIDKPLTIEGTGTRPLLRNTSGTFSFGIFDVPTGTVTFRGLDFEVPAGGRNAILAQMTYPKVVVEDCGFEILGPGLAAGLTGIETGLNDTGQGSVLVSGSDFRGGWVGVFAYVGAEAEISGSSFTDHTFGGIQYQSGARGLVENSVIGSCGIYGCVRVIDSAVDVTGNTLTESRTDVDAFNHSVLLYALDATGTVADNQIDGCGFGQCFTAISRADVDVLRNQFTLYEPHGTRIVLAASDGTVGQAPDYASRAPDVTIADNVIIGVGGTADVDPGNSDAYAVKIAGILVENAAVARVFRNEIENVETGILVSNFDFFFNDPSVPGNDGGNVVAGSDNTVTLVRQGVAIFGSSVANLESSDFTGYFHSIVEDGNDEPSDLTCNWWGSASGPQNHAVSNPDVEFTPWATAPVAGTSTTTCSGGV